jgi:Fe2+ or Zn2+ uptake regulation protein
VSSELIKEVEQACLERGLRLTPLRADVLLLVAESSLPVKAYDVLQRIRESAAITAPPTVYRSLEFLLENGFIHKLESLNAYVACQAPQSIHTGTFLICDHCGDRIDGRACRSPLAQESPRNRIHAAQRNSDSGNPRRMQGMHTALRLSHHSSGLPLPYPTPAVALRSTRRSLPIDPRDTRKILRPRHSRLTPDLLARRKQRALFQTPHAQRIGRRILDCAGVGWRSAVAAE